MAVFKKYANKRIAPDDPNWDKGKWYVWRRVHGSIIHRSLKGVVTEEEALEVERMMTREIAVHGETKVARRAAQKLVGTTINTSGFVYIFESGGYYKIGRTNNIGKRLAEITKTIIPFQTNVVMAMACKDAVGVEKRLHREFDKFKATGEWFNFNSAALAKVKRMLVQLSDQEIYYI